MLEPRKFCSAINRLLKIPSNNFSHYILNSVKNFQFYKSNLYARVLKSDHLIFTKKKSIPLQSLKEAGEA